MTTRLVLVSDTHLPLRAKRLPATLWHDVDSADLVVHAGDWVQAPLLDELEARSRDLLAVYGNNDGPELRRRVPEVARRRVEGLSFAVVHETGAAQGRERRMDAAFPDADVLVFGHSHIPWDTTTERGMRLLNPGSPTDRRRQPDFSWMRATVDGTELEVELVRLAPGQESPRSDATG